MKRVVLAAITATAAFSLVPLSSANAAEGDADRGFPELGFEWYVTAPPAQYAAGVSPSAGIDETLAEDGIRASYFAPNGSAPSRGQGDVALSVSLPYDEPSTSDRIDVDLSQLVDLQLDTRARFIDGFALPQEAEYEVTGAVISTPEVEWSESTLTIIRPPMPVVCSATDINQFEFQVAALGDNGYKYLFDVDVSFGRRSVAASNEQKRRCGSGRVETPKPSTTNEPRPQSSENPATPVEQQTTNDASTSSNAVSQEAPEPPEWLPIPFALIVLAIGIWFITRYKKRKTNQPAHANDGTRLSPATKKRSTENDDD
ncbi:hypothetical protein BWO91_17655 [Plantibacter flavus]|uniref:hypothetical protein n=1 Tax=Plantibacter flavus TaxID=150123 RepID=UPI00099B731E|nr:hypothetical protein [Plantibacter flavus]AQX81546.1 hypothetical protein BWO91_17655 [Plantibacter flavus]